MKPILVTVCTNRKLVPPAGRLSAQDLPVATQVEVAQIWRKWVREEVVRYPAQELYAGRGFTEAVATTKSTGADLWIMSAGLGLIHGNEEVPAYDLTLSPRSTNTITEKINDGPFDASLWWSEIGRRTRPKRCFFNLAKDHPRRLVVVSVPATYLHMISDDLLLLNDKELERFRLVGPLTDVELPDRLQPLLMPYDDRLNGPNSPLKGTRADFPQRAARHFMEQIWLTYGNESAEKHVKRVLESLGSFSFPKVPKRLQLNDKEIVSKILSLWDRAEGKSGRMLRILRDEEKIACEQGRFVKIFKHAHRLKESGESPEEYLRLRAVRSSQGNDTEIYSFFIPGECITEIADISRIHRNENGSLSGFQRKEIRSHVNSIIEYLDEGPALFPNAIILAFSPEVAFTQARGNKPDGAIDSGQAGTLSIPIREEGQRVAWIVDGQQRSLALSKVKNRGIHVPVIAFVAPDLETQREQFILVNKAKPLPTRLINELLPEVDTHLPRDLSARKIPSALCELLNKDPESPFHGLIKRMSASKNEQAVILDNSIIEMIKVSIKNPNGALAPFKTLGKGPSDTEGMYRTLVMFWSAVKQIFPEAWGLPPAKSRLMHSAGLRAMGSLMDRIVNRAAAQPDPASHIVQSLTRIAPYCRWIEGVWEDLGLPWNEIQTTSSHLRKLSEVLCRLDYEASVKCALL